MSISKPRIWRLPAAAALVLAVAALWVAGAGSAQAGGEGSVSTTTTGNNVAINVTPPTETLSIWIIEVHYDPAIVQVARTGEVAQCTTLNIPGGVAAAAGCDTRDDDLSNPDDDTLVALGGWVENVGGTATGLDSPTVVATATFTAVGDPGDCSDLTIVVASFLDPEGASHTPTVTNGEICVASGTSRLWGDSDCDAEISSRDNQALLRNVLDQNPLGQTEPCPDLGTGVTVDGTSRLWGDWDCDGEVSSRDNQALLRNVLQQNPLSQTEPCPDIGASASVS